MRTLRCPTGNIWLKVWIAAAKIEVLVSNGKVRVILRDGSGPSIVEEDDLIELQIEETVKGVRDGGRAEAGVERGRGKPV